MKYNAARCRLCDEVLVSRFRHDFQQCTCLNGSYIDGGSSYIRLGGADLTQVEFGEYDESTKKYAAKEERKNEN